MLLSDVSCGSEESARNLWNRLVGLTMDSVKTLRPSLVIAAVVLSGCSAPGAVEGVFSDASFHLLCAQPLAKPVASERDMLVVLSEHDSETLRTVNVRLPGAATWVVGEPVRVGRGAPDTDSPTVEVTVGDLLVDVRGDGVEILSSTNTVRASSVGGTLVLEERSADGVSGTFDVQLDDDGYLEGHFAAVMTR